MRWGPNLTEFVTIPNISITSLLSVLSFYSKPHIILVFLDDKACKIRLTIKAEGSIFLNVLVDHYSKTKAGTIQQIWYLHYLALLKKL